MMAWAKRNLIERGGLLTLAALVFYVWFACPYIVENDNAEFSTLGTIGGIAHPSGYPLYILWLRAWSWLPVASPAHAAAIATAILGALGVGVLHAACRAWGARALAASIAVGLYATAPLIVRYSTEAEAFALNNLVVACVLWLAAARGPVRGTTRAFLLGLVAGLGLSNHMTCALIAPIGILGVVRGAQERGVARGVGAAVLGLALGLTPYLYMFVANDSLISWRHPDTLGDVAEIFLRIQFGGPFGFAGLGGQGSASAQVTAMFLTLGRSWLWVGLAVGLGGLGARCLRTTTTAPTPTPTPTAESGEPRTGWALLAVSFVLAGPVLASRFDMPLNTYGTYVAQRFHLIPVLLLVIPVAAGADWIGHQLAEFLRGFARIPVGALIAVGLMVSAIRVLPYLQRFQSPAMELEVRNTLGTLPPSAVVLGMDGELDVGFRYLQLACGLRPDVMYIRWGTIHLPWYREHFTRDGLVFVPRAGAEPEPEQELHLAQAVLASGRPLFVAPSEAAGLARLVLYPHGILLRVLPAGTALPPVSDVAALNHALFSRFSLDYPRPGPDDQYATFAHRAYAKAWKRIGDELARAHRTDEAAAAYELVRQLQPAGS